jgi:para-aminobenzoate synthetase component I
LILQRRKATFPIAPGEHRLLKQRMLDWSKQFSILLFLDSNEYAGRYGRYECLLAAGAETIIEYGGNGLSNIRDWHMQHNDWLLGHISYDFKNALERKLTTRHQPVHHFPLLQFFCPQTVCYINAECTTLTIECLREKPEQVYASILETEVTTPAAMPKLSFLQRINQTDYLTTIEKIRQHIADGDCYEINFCNKGHCTADVDPRSVYQTLNALSPAPFAAYYRLQQRYMMCASPERYLHKTGSTILSQPIKGTARRSPETAIDEANKRALYESRKERAENVMIVDLVRNDLARSCETGSIQVEELFGIYSFPQVHQMISTVSGQLRPDMHFTDAIRYSFPMGSMTGAPKVKVMQLIDHYEQAARELFSGTVGYITPEGDFDFNVVIRSLFYNAESQRLSYQTGGAITWDSNPGEEWEEMRLKAWALEKIFS